jgi:tetratricopeptide (TPR) repeat protein
MNARYVICLSEACQTPKRVVQSLMVYALTCSSALAGAPDFLLERLAFTKDLDAAVFETPPGTARDAAFEALHQRTAELARMHPTRAEPLVLQAWGLRGHATVKGRTMSALIMGKQALEKLESAIAIDPDVYGAATYTSLGAMHVAVCDLPFVFGCTKKARVYLQKALELDPGGAEQHLWYAELLFIDEDFAGAQRHARAAAEAPPRPDRATADKILQEQVRELMKRLAEKAHR